MRSFVRLGANHSHSRDADIGRLADAIGLPRQRSVWPRALGGAAVAASLIAAGWLKPWVPADPSSRLVGSWQAEVRYDWGAKHDARFEFKHHAGQLTGTAPS